MSGQAEGSTTGGTEEVPQFRYTADTAAEIEQRWQRRWEERGTFHAPNPAGSLKGDVPADKLFVQDMFPYPSGSGLHVGHPLGYIGTDVYARYHRMLGRNVLHTMGFDSFGCQPSSTRCRPGRTRAPPPRPTSSGSWGRSAAWAWATTSAAGSPPPTSSSTAGRSGSSCRSSMPGTTPRPTAARAAPGRSASWWSSSSPASAPPRTVARGPS